MGYTATITRAASYVGTIERAYLAMSNYVINRDEITGLTGGTSVKLDGLSAATLSGLRAGAMLRLSFTGSIMADYRLRANTGAETTSAPWRVVSVNDSTKVFELVGIWKQGTPCVWDATLSKFKQLLVASGAPALSDDADAFTLP